MGSPPSEFEARTGAIRETAKWLTVTLCGTGSVLFSGLSIVGLSTSTEGWWWIAVVVLAALPLVCAGVMAGLTAKLSAVPYRGVESVLPGVAGALRGLAGGQPAPQSGQGQLRREIEKIVPRSVSVHGSLAAFEQQVTEAVGARDKAEKAFKGQPTDARDAERVQASALVEALLADVAEVLACAEYVEVRDAWARTRRLIYGLAGISVAAVLGAGAISKYTDGPQYKEVTVPLPVRVYAPSAGVTLGPVDGCALTDGQPATVIAGTLREPVLLFPAGIPGSPTVAPSAAPRSEVPRSCSRPVTWTPDADQVLVEPLSASSPTGPVPTGRTPGTSGSTPAPTAKPAQNTR